MFSYIIIFVCIWWLIFFMALPFGSGVERVEAGHADSAPANPHLGIKIIITTIIASIITIIAVYFLKR